MGCPRPGSTDTTTATETCRTPGAAASPRRPSADWRWREAAPSPAALAAALAIGAFAAAGTVARAVFLGTNPGDAAATAVADGLALFLFGLLAYAVGRAVPRRASPLLPFLAGASALTLALAARAALLASAGLSIGIW